MITNDSFTRIKNDTNGNPRYVIHFLDLDNDYENALKIAKKLGGRKFHNKQYGGGIVFQSYNNRDLANRLNQLIGAL
jgi:hypothetical protein